MLIDLVEILISWEKGAHDVSKIKWSVKTPPWDPGLEVVILWNGRERPGLVSLLPRNWSCFSRRHIENLLERRISCHFKSNFFILTMPAATLVEQKPEKEEDNYPR